jgi:hypothetical protein
MSNQQYVCDFCSKPEVKWSFLAETFIAFTTPTIVGSSVGNWAACDECRLLVEAENKERLLERSWESLLYDHPEILYLEERYRVSLKNFIKTRHQQFFEHRVKKEAIPV